MKLPNVWGQGGALFAFSGFDGETESLHQLIGATSTQGRGIDFYTDTPACLSFGLPAYPQIEQYSVTDDIVSGDVISSRISVSDCSLRLRYLFADKDTVIGEIRALQTPESVDVRIVVEIESGTAEAAGSAVTFYSRSEEFSLTARGPEVSVDDRGATARLKTGESLYFSFAYSSAAATSSKDRAESGLLVDQDKLFEDRLGFFERLPQPKVDGPRIERAYYKCAAVQKVNCCSAEGDIEYDWSTPDRWPHKYMWIWDSAFHALGLRHFAPEWACNSIRAALSKQRPDGFIPHKMTPDSSLDSNHIQPPILAWAAWKTHSTAHCDGFLEYCYPRLKNMVLYDCRELDRDGTGLSQWDVPKFASGMDNSPRFDQEIGTAVDLNAYLVSEMAHLGRMAECLGLSDDASMWSDMLRERSVRVNELLWDEEDGFYYDLDPCREKIRVKTIAGFTPLFAGVSSDEQASILVRQLTDPDMFWRPLPASSVAAGEASFSDDMWRGPVWVNFNYFLIEGLEKYGYNGLASELRDKTLREIARWYTRDGVIYEFYDSEAGRSPSELARKGRVGIRAGRRNVRQCIRDYHWTASIFVDLALSWNKKDERTLSQSF